ncbi:MAG: DUF2610 domain-containing protein [Rickettsiales bacterium]|nr:DUF2610 domain-containing protein [Rickettsiales bacterium]
MKKLSIPCSFGAQNHPVDFYVGQPRGDKHPIQSQSNWLSSARGGSVPGNVMQSLEKLHDLSKTNRVDFGELCEYAINTADSSASIDDKSKRAKSSPQQSLESVPQDTQAPAPVKDESPVIEPVPQATQAPAPVKDESPVIESVPQAAQASAPVIEPVPQATQAPAPVIEPVPQATQAPAPVIEPVPQATQAPAPAKEESSLGKDGLQSSSYSLTKEQEPGSESKKATGKKAGSESSLTDQDIDDFLNS